jgi:hypothetical protein
VKRSYIKGLSYHSPPLTRRRNFSFVCQDQHVDITVTVSDSALPEDCQDLPVARYCDEGVAGISHRLHYVREEGTDEWTAHAQLW